MKRRALLLTLLVLLLVVVIPGGFFAYVIHQEQLNEALIAAIKQHETSAVKTLLKQGADPNSRVSIPPRDWRAFLQRLFARRSDHLQGLSALLLAGEAGDLPTMQELILRGAEVNCKDAAGNTPLLLALCAEYHGFGSKNWQEAERAWQALQISVAKSLLERGADVRVRDDHGRTPLEEATTQLDDIDLVKRILDRGADDAFTPDQLGLSPCHMAIYVNDVEVVRLFLDHASHSPGRPPINVMFQQAAGDGAYRVVTLLLERGADPNIREQDGTTPLMCAAYYRPWDREEALAETARILLAHGAEIDARDNDGNTALFLAIAHDHSDLAECLLRHGAKAQITNKEGTTLQEIAAKHSSSYFNYTKLLKRFRNRK